VNPVRFFIGIRDMEFKRARAAHLRLGRLGEQCAVQLLKHRNCLILARDWRRKGGELDLVALDGGTLVFVEVKTRRRFDGYRPLANLTPGQMLRIRRGAAKYLRAIRRPDLPLRFDLIEVIHDGRRLRDIALHQAYMALDVRAGTHL